MNLCFADSGSTADATRVVGATAEGVIQIAAPANSTIGILGIYATFDGQTAANPKVLCEVLRYATPLTSGSTGWSAVTEVNINGTDSATPQAVVIQADQSATPADAGSPVVIYREWVHPQSTFKWTPSGLKVKEGTALSLRLSCASSGPHYIAGIHWVE